MQLTIRTTATSQAMKESPKEGILRPNSLKVYSPEIELGMPVSLECSFKKEHFVDMLKHCEETGDESPLVSIEISLSDTLILSKFLKVIYKHTKK